MSAQTEKLWDSLIRLFHWSIAGIFIANYFFNEAGDSWHQWLGYIAVAWLVVRFFWGFFGAGAGVGQIFSQRLRGLKRISVPW